MELGQQHQQRDDHTDERHRQAGGEYPLLDGGRLDLRQPDHGDQRQQPERREQCEQARAQERRGERRVLGLGAEVEDGRKEYVTLSRINGVAAVGILVNGATALMFMRGSDLNIRGAYLHMAADAL